MKVLSWKKIYGGSILHAVIEERQSGRFVTACGEESAEGNKTIRSSTNKCDKCLAKLKGPIDMVVVKIELWPGGDKSAGKEIGRIEIANDGTGDANSGNYEATLFHAGKYYGKPGFWRRGKVIGYLRALSPYHLVLMAIQAAFRGK